MRKLHAYLMMRCRQTMSQMQNNIYFLCFQSLIPYNGKQSSEGSPHPVVETGRYGLEPGAREAVEACCSI